jgi:hypothetical protein
MKYVTKNAFGCSLLLVSGTAVAQPAEPEVGSVLPVDSATINVGPLQLHHFNVRARTQGRRLEVRSLHDIPITRCVTVCRLNVPSGDYKVVFYDSVSQAHEFAFSVSGPGGLEIADADPDTASTALGFGIAGAALVGVGTVLLPIGFAHSCVMGECEERSPAWAGYLVLGGLGAVLVGTVMAPIGFVTWSRNRLPRSHETEPEPGPERENGSEPEPGPERENGSKPGPTGNPAPAVNLAVVPTRDGAYFGLSGSF